LTLNFRKVDFLDQGTLRPKVVFLPQFSQTAIVHFLSQNRLLCSFQEPGNLTTVHIHQQGERLGALRIYGLKTGYRVERSRDTRALNAAYVSAQRGDRVRKALKN